MLSTFSFEFACQGPQASLIKEEQLLAEIGLFSASLHYFLHICTGKTFCS